MVAPTLPDRIKRYKEGLSSGGGMLLGINEGAPFTSIEQGMLRVLDAMYPDLAVDLTPAQGPGRHVALDKQVEDLGPLIDLSRVVDRNFERQICVRVGEAGPPDLANLGSKIGPSLGEKPRGAFYTSSAGSSDHGMWNVFLRAFETISLHPKPWVPYEVTWSFEPRICRVNTAEEWFRFAVKYRKERAGSGWVSVDWCRVALDWDAVHLSVRAEFTVEGIPITDGSLIVRPSFWSVETTVWLNAHGLTVEPILQPCGK